MVSSNFSVWVFVMEFYLFIQEHLMNPSYMRDCDKCQKYKDKYTSVTTLKKLRLVNKKIRLTLLFLKAMKFQILAISCSSTEHDDDNDDGDENVY